MVLDIVHDLGDTCLMVLEEGGGHDWVQADEGKFSGLFSTENLLSECAQEGHRADL